MLIPSGWNGGCALQYEEPPLRHQFRLMRRCYIPGWGWILLYRLQSGIAKSNETKSIIAVKCHDFVVVITRTVSITNFDVPSPRGTVRGNSVPAH